MIKYDSGGAYLQSQQFPNLSKAVSTKLHPYREPDFVEQKHFCGLLIKHPRTSNVPESRQYKSDDGM